MANLAAVARLPFNYVPLRRKRDDDAPDDQPQPGAVDPKGGLFGRMGRTTQPMDETMPNGTPALNAARQFVTSYTAPKATDTGATNPTPTTLPTRAPLDLSAVTLDKPTVNEPPMKSAPLSAKRVPADQTSWGRRPEYVDTGDPTGDRQRYMDALRGWRNPPGGSRIGAAAKEAVQEFLQSFLQGGLPAGIRGAGVGFGRGLATPNIGNRRWRDEQLARVGQEQTQDAAQRKTADEHDYNQARTNETEAQADYWRRRPDLEKQKTDAQSLTRAQTALRSELKQRLQNPRPFDADDPYDSDLQQRAQAAGVGFDPSGFGDHKNPFTIEVIDPNDPSGTRKTRARFNRESGEFEPITIGDKPVATGYVQPVDPKTGETPAQEQAHSDRGAGQAERHRHNVAAEGQAQQNAARRGRPTTANQNARLARAAELTRKLDEEKARAAHPPHEINGRATTPEFQQGYSARHKQNAAAYAQQIKDAYGDLYESGADDSGWAYAKPRPHAQPNAQPQGGGVYAGHRFSRSQLPEIRKRLGVSSDEEAERIITSQGGVFY
jgi:hypothetical protein